MNLKYPSLIFLILVVYIVARSERVTTIKKTDQEHTLDLVPSSGLIYIELNDFSSGDTVYFMIKTNNGKLDNSINVGYANNGNNDYPESWEQKSPYLTVSSQSSSESKLAYYYSLDYKNYDYLVVNYYGFDPWSGGKLIVQCSDENLASDTIKLILIIVFSVVGFIIIVVIVVIVIICVIRKKRVGFVHGINNVSPIAPQDPLMNSNQPYYPPQNPQPNLYAPS